MKTDYRTLLTEYYLDNGVSSNLERCKNQEQCEKEANPRKLWKGAGAHVGSKYGDPYRVVVVSLDRGDAGGNKDSGDPEKRSLEIESIWGKDLNQHMSGTKHLLEAILKNVYPDENLFSHYAMTNAAKCCGADKSMSSVPEALYRNCAEFSRREIQLLEPDLVVAQGKMALCGLWNYYRKLDEVEISEVLKHLDAKSGYLQQIVMNLLAEHIQRLTIGDVSAVLLVLPHPSARGGQWQHYEKYFLALSVEIIRFLIAKNHR